MSMPPNFSMPSSAAALHGGQIAHIGNDGQHSVLTQPGCHFFEQRLVDIRQYQLGALVVQAARHLRADTVGAAGDQGDLSVH